MKGRKRPAAGSSAAPPEKKKRETSKVLTVTVIAAGIVIVQECFALMLLAILRGYTSTAAWLTAAVGLAEAVIAAGLSGYLSLAKSDHSEGGITFEAAKAKGFTDSGGIDSPPI